MKFNATRAGITAPNRQRLTTLHRAFDAPFSVADAARALDLDEATARRFLAYLAARGWLARVHRNRYVKVPLDASAPADWREDPWVVAVSLFSPCFIAGWSAAEHWGLTEQLFREVMVITGRPVRHRHQVVQGTPFRVKVVPDDRLFGTRLVWRGQTRVPVSDPARTVADLLDDPGLGGGSRHVAEVVERYFTGEARDDHRLLEYIERLGNWTGYKRLGYLLEALHIDAPTIVRAGLERKSAGPSLLDPQLPPQGPVLRRWNLRVNAHVAPGSPG
jgi:predicted transcriptional regulator of viral defense system